LLKRREIVRRGAVKYVAVRRLALFEKTSFDELRDGLRNFRGPLSNAGVEHPPVKDTVDGVLRIRMAGQIVENFWRGRWKSWVGEHTLGVSRPSVAIDVPAVLASPTRRRIMCLCRSREFQFLL